MTFGAEADEATSHAILGDYVAAGGILIDTADVYGKGASEEIIGRRLRAHPTDSPQVEIATKGRFTMGDGPNDLTARPGATSVARLTRRCGASAWSRSTSTRCTPGTGRGDSSSGNAAIMERVTTSQPR
jgi:aryl-alcohol dehydrogenase-like predicted oxidoreductase